MTTSEMRDLRQLFTDRRLWRGSLVWTLVIFIIANVLVVSCRDDLLGERLQLNVAKAQQGRAAKTPAIPPEQADGIIRYDRSIGDRLAEFWPYIPDARRYNLTLLAGMSQMYTINDYTPGDKVIAEWLDDSVRTSGGRVFGLAAPNLSYEEATYLLLNTLTSSRTTPDNFILAICFEKFREVAVRPTYQAYMRDHPELLALWRTTAQEYRVRYPLAAEAMERTTANLFAEGAVDESSLEARIRAATSRAIPIVAERRALNAQLQQTVYLMRNAALGIKPWTKRPLIPAQFEMNKQFVAMIADIGRAHGVRVIMYNVPFNPRGRNPYIPEEYAAFKEWFFSFTKRDGIPSADLEGIVPEEAWGTYLDGPDYKHFRAEGHRLTALALHSHFRLLLTGPGKP
jgi:hypothetical protein